MKEDVKREHKELFEASTKFINEVHVPSFLYIMVDGVGNPTVPEFKLKSKAVHAMAKALKSYYRCHYGIEYMTSPLEGVWDTYDNAKFDVTRKKMIKFTLQMIQPDYLTEEIFEIVKGQLLNRRNPMLYLEDLYLKRYEEGKCIQMLHVGPYNTEIMTTKEIMEYIIVQNMKLNGMHHEIYLNNPDRVAEERLKTIVRYPVSEYEL